LPRQAINSTPNSRFTQQARILTYRSKEEQGGSADRDKGTYCFEKSYPLMKNGDRWQYDENWRDGHD
jgi:hypothetical protein